MEYKFKQFRKENNLTQEELAKYLNIDRTTYSSYENQKCEPNIETLKKLSKIFNCSIDYLVNNENTNTIYIFDNDEKILLDNYQQLNKTNKIKANSYILGLLAGQ